MSVVAVYEVGDVGGATDIDGNTPLPVGSTRLRGGGKAVGSPLAFVRLNFKEKLGGVENEKPQLVTLIEDAGRPIQAVLATHLCRFEDIVLDDGEIIENVQYLFDDRYFNDPGRYEYVDEFSRVSSGLKNFFFVVPVNYPRKLVLIVTKIADDASAGKRCIPAGTSMILTLLLGE